LAAKPADSGAGRAGSISLYLSILAAALILMLALIAYGRLLAPGTMPYSPHSDMISQHLATRQVLYDSVNAGNGLPLWREDQFAGCAAITNLQSMYFFPPHFLFYLLPPQAAAGPTLWLNFIIAAVAFYVLGMALQLRFGGRLFVAIAGLFNFKLIIVNYSGWLSHVAGIAMLPLMLAAVVYFARRPSWPRALAMALLMGLGFSAGHIQYYYFALLLIAAYSLVHAVAAWRSRQRPMLARFAIRLTAAAVLTAAMTACIVLPLIAELPFIARTDITYEFFLAEHSLQWSQLLTFLYPEALGTPLDGTYRELWEDVAYFGLIPLALAVFGAVRAWTRPATAFLAIGFVAAVILSVDTPLLKALWQYFPGFKLFRCPSRFLFIAAVLGIALAGIGFDELYKWLAEKKAMPKAALLTGALLMLLVSAEGVYYARRYVRCAPQDRVWPDTDSAGYLGVEPGPYRLAPIFRRTINYGWAATLKLQLVTGFDSYNYRHYWKYMDLITAGRISPLQGRVWADIDSIFRTDLLDALNAEYVVADYPITDQWESLELISILPGRMRFVLYKGMDTIDLYLYRNRTAMPRVFWVDRVLGARDERRALELIRQSDLHDTAVVLDAAQANAEFPPIGRDAAQLRDFRSGHLVVHIEARQRRFLVISEIWHPGWHASLDGQKLELLRTDLALMGAWIPPGEHRLQIDFEPPCWTLGKCISLAALALCLLLLTLNLYNIRRSDKP